MRKYDRSQPLVMIHIPKSAGTSARVIFDNWFKEGLLTHYFEGTTGKMPQKYDLLGMHTIQTPIVVYGHFNKLRKFGVEDYYPEVKQCVTIVRNPLELTISRYFFIKKNIEFMHPSQVPKEDTLEEFLQNCDINMLNHFPREMNMTNYKEIIEEYFIDIGITEYLDESMKRIANKLGFEYNSDMLGYLNVTKRDQEISAEAKETFVKKHELEFAVYNYALERHIQQRTL